MRSKINTAFFMAILIAVLVSMPAAAQWGGGGGGGGGGGYEIDCADGIDDDGDGDIDCDDTDCDNDLACPGGGGGGGGGGGIPEPPERCALAIELENDGYTVESEDFDDDGSGQATCTIEASRTATGFTVEFECLETDGSEGELDHDFTGGTVKTVVHGRQLYEYDDTTEQWGPVETGWEKCTSRDSVDALGSYHETEVAVSDDGVTETPDMRSVDHDLRFQVALPPSATGWAECRSAGVRVQMGYDGPGDWQSDYGRIELTRCGREEFFNPIPPPPLPIPPVDYDEHFVNLVRDFEDGETRWETRRTVTIESRYDQDEFLSTITKSSHETYIDFPDRDVPSGSGEHRRTEVSTEAPGAQKRVVSVEETGLDASYSVVTPGPWPEVEISVSYHKNETSYVHYMTYMPQQHHSRLGENTVERIEFTDTIVIAAAGIIPLDLGGLASFVPSAPHNDPRFSIFYDRSTFGFGHTDTLPNNAAHMWVNTAADGGGLTRRYASWGLDGELDGITTHDGGEPVVSVDPTADNYEAYLLPSRDFEDGLENGETRYFPDASGGIP